MGPEYGFKNRNSKFNDSQWSFNGFSEKRGTHFIQQSLEEKNEKMRLRTIEKLKVELQQEETDYSQLPKARECMASDKILYLSNNAEIDKVLTDYIFNKKGKLYTGFDLELKPTFFKPLKKRVCVIQIAVKGTVLVITTRETLSDKLIQFLKDPTIIKMGVGMCGDINSLLYTYSIKLQGGIELGELAQIVGFRHPSTWGGHGLSALCIQVLGMFLEKQPEMILSRWDHEKLSQEQINYAALDAWASYQVGIKLIERFDYKQLNNEPCINHSCRICDQEFVSDDAMKEHVASQQHVLRIKKVADLGVLI